MLKIWLHWADSDDDAGWQAGRQVEEGPLQPPATGSTRMMFMAQIFMQSTQTLSAPLWTSFTICPDWNPLWPHTPNLPQVTMTSLDFSSDSGLDPVLFTHTNPMLSSIMTANLNNMSTAAPNVSITSSEHQTSSGKFYECKHCLTLSVQQYRTWPMGHHPSRLCQQPTSVTRLEILLMTLHRIYSLTKPSTEILLNCGLKQVGFFARKVFWMPEGNEMTWNTVPGMTEFVARSQSPLISSVFSGGSSQPKSTISNAISHQQNKEWLGDPDLKDPEDINMIQGFGSLTSSALLEKVRELQDLAYQLGVEEAQEMTRGRFLNVLAATSSSTTRCRKTPINQSSPTALRIIKKECDSSHENKSFTPSRVFDSQEQQQQPMPNGSSSLAAPTDMDIADRS